MDITQPTPNRGTPAATTSPPTGVVVASRETESDAVAAVVRHHAELAGALTTLTDAVLTAAGGVAGVGVSAVEAAQHRLVDFCTGELLPHAAAEESALYPAAASEERARLLVESMLAEHRVLESLVAEVRASENPVRAAAAANALRVLFDVHLAKENDLLLPLIAADPSVSLATILTGMHELLGADEQHVRENPLDHRDRPDAATGSAETHGAVCGCGGSDGDQEAPVLDVRDVPHAIRHATVFGAVGAVPIAGSLVLVAPHDPLPLLGQLEEREPGAFGVSYDQRGPDAWRVRLTRTR